MINTSPHASIRPSSLGDEAAEFRRELNDRFEQIVVLLAPQVILDRLAPELADEIRRIVTSRGARP